MPGALRVSWRAGAVSRRARGGLLAFAAAYVDTVGFIGLFGLFTAHVTGNFVLIGAELVNRHTDMLVKLSDLTVFVLSVALGPFMQSGVALAGFAVIGSKDVGEAIAKDSKSPWAVSHRVVEVWPLRDSC